MYINTPSNSMYIKKSTEWISLYEKYQMVLLDGYDLGVPEVKSYIVDIPGGHGSLDITESVYGDIPLKNRQQTFNFMIFNLKKVENFEAKRDQIMKTFHGHTFKFKIGEKSEFYYEGRFNLSLPSFSNTSTHDIVMSFTVSVDAKPFKTKIAIGHVEQICIGGQKVRIDNGRKKVLPTIQLPVETYIAFNNNYWTLGPGTFVINDLILNEGTNYIYFDTYKLFVTKWSDLFRLNTNAYKPTGYDTQYRHVVYTNTSSILDNLIGSGKYKSYICSLLDTPKINGKTITWTTKGNYVGVCYSTEDTMPKYGSGFLWNINSPKNPKQEDASKIKIEGPTWGDLKDYTFNELITSTGGVSDYLKTAKTPWKLLSEFTWSEINTATWNSLMEIDNIKQNIKQKPVIVEWEVCEI